MIATVCILLLIWVVVSQFRTQQALRWWFHRQMVQRCQEADVIRNGVLQECFVLRRGLELTLESSSESSTQNRQGMLAAVETLHDSFKHLSETLAPPYIEDSLPLAIQCAMDSWQVTRTTVRVEMNLLDASQSESQEQRRLLLAAFLELLQLASADRAREIHLDLTAQQTQPELKVQITYPSDADPLDYTDQTQLGHLKRAFSSLMPGQCLYHWNQHTLIWYFRWKSSSGKPSTFSGVNNDSAVYPAPSPEDPCH